MRRVDAWAGLLCVAIGLLTLFEANRYTIGSLGRMGPGFYPAILGCLLTGIGVLMAIVGVEQPAEDPLHAFPQGPEWRGRLCIVGGVALFILLAEHAGLAPATFACVFTAALGDRKAVFGEALGLAVGITIFGALLFRYFLGVNLPLWP